MSNYPPQKERNGITYVYDPKRSAKHAAGLYSSKPPSGGPLGGGNAAPAAATWSFPQYSQTWAFTPPAGPQPIMTPPKFDPSSSTGYYGVGSPSSSKSKDSKSSMSSSATSLMDLWKKYGIA